MKICTACYRCFEDTAVLCPQENYNSLVAARSGSCEVAAGYRLERLLERDAFGETYQAARINSNESFAIRFFAADSKSESPNKSESVSSEMQAAARINHPNVNRVIESGATENGEFYVVTELIGGDNVRDFLRSVGSLSETAAIIIARQIAEGLEATHRAGVIHRGVSLANIVLTGNETNPLAVKLCNFDFGGFRQRAVVADISDANPQIDILRYLSPEQCASQTVNERTDIYSLGVAFYEMLTGRSPFDPTLEAIVHKQIN